MRIRIQRKRKQMQIHLERGKDCVCRYIPTSTILYICTICTHNFSPAVAESLTASWNIFAKTNILSKPFQTVYQGPRWVQFMKKRKKSRDTATLRISLSFCSANFCDSSSSSNLISGLRVGSLGPVV